jgi:hypothetical protein
MRAHLVGRIGNLGHAGDIVGQPLVVGLGFAQALRRGESELRVALGSHAIPSFRVCLSSRPLIRVPNDFVRSAPSSERSRSPARSPLTVRAKTRAGGACSSELSLTRHAAVFTVDCWPKSICGLLRLCARSCYATTSPKSAGEIESRRADDAVGRIV